MPPSSSAIAASTRGCDHPSDASANGPENDGAAAGGPAIPADERELFNPNLLLRDFLQERWKGVTPILWGQQLKQERLDELIYLSVMNADHLPDRELSSPVTDFYHFDTTPNDNLEVPE